MELKTAYNFVQVVIRCQHKKSFQFLKKWERGKTETDRHTSNLSERQTDRRLLLLTTFQNDEKWERGKKKSE